MTARDDILRILDDLADACYTAGAAGPDESVKIDPYVDRVLAVIQPRTWFGEAQAAFDQGLTEAGGRDGFPTPDFWLQRAQVAATMAGAEQQRIANLIAWKQLQATRQATRDAGIDLMPLSTVDAATDEIERAIGLEPWAPSTVSRGRSRT